MNISALKFKLIPASEHSWPTFTHCDFCNILSASAKLNEFRSSCNSLVIISGEFMCAPPNKHRKLHTNYLFELVVWCARCVFERRVGEIDDDDETILANYDVKPRCVWLSLTTHRAISFSSVFPPLPLAQLSTLLSKHNLISPPDQIATKGSSGWIIRAQERWKALIYDWQSSLGAFR